ncbi:HipA domain-containing protein [Dermacoccus nishinomiyaensis]|nr:MAG: hypothetical protein DI618_02485 [Dermacoccus nishinomiyaensis]TJZ98664.1 HipA domain-containing protein [Dermacoccus nishinomiyaensis]
MRVRRWVVRAPRPSSWTRTGTSCWRSSPRPRTTPTSSHGRRSAWTSPHTLGSPLVAVAEAFEPHMAASGRVDLAELWKRTVLNLLVGNKDNHLRNHGFQPHHDRAVRDGFDGVMRQRTREVLGERPAPSCWISPHMTPPLDRWGDAVSVGARFAHRSPLHVAPAPNAPRRCERRGRAVKGARAV